MTKVGDDFFTSPRLRDDVTVSVRPGAVAVDYRRQGCVIDVPEEANDQMAALFGLLGAGSPVAALREAAPGFADGLDDLLVELDRLGLLTEGAVADRPFGRTGLDLYHEARGLAARIARDCASSRMYDGLRAGTVSTNALVGYAIEYYHLVHLSPALIAPALGHATSPAAYRLMVDFAASEFGHDAMLRDSLASVGIGEATLDELVPLRTTLSVCSSLGVIAAQDPLSFWTCLFLFEEPAAEFNAAIVSRSRDLGLPEAFAAPMVKHAVINDDADHDDISRALLAEVPFVSDEQRRAALKHLVTLVELYVAMENEILDWYDVAGTPRLRQFGRAS